MKANLDLGDADEELDLIAEIERAVGIVLTDEEMSRMETLGDLADRLGARLRPADGKCASSMTFYRVRWGLKRMGVAQRIAPETPLSSVIGRHVRAELGQLGRLTALAVPRARGAWMSYVGGALIFVGLVAFVGALAEQSWTFLSASIGLSVAAGLLIWADDGKLPHGIDTVGDLVRRTAALSHGRLTMEGAAARPAELFAVVREVIGEETGIPASELGRETRFWPLRADVAT